jgi:hypothetical protein
MSSFSLRSVSAKPLTSILTPATLENESLPPSDSVPKRTYDIKQYDDNALGQKTGFQLTLLSLMQSRIVGIGFRF